MPRWLHSICFYSSALAVAALVVAAGGFAALRWLDLPPSADRFAAAADPDGSTEVFADGRIGFAIAEGESAASVGRRLAAVGLIRSSGLWILYARLDSASLKAGLYAIAPPVGMLELREMFVAGRQLQVSVTIPEGYTINKIGALLEEDGICPAAEFIAAAGDGRIAADLGLPSKSLEGFLFPDTYFFPLRYPAAKIAERLAKTSVARLTELVPESVGMAPEEIYKRMIIASIVEREYRAADEAPRIAGVFFNRLAIGMALQSCATIEYVITEIEGKPHPATLTYADLDIASPYNTYRHRELPPTPIANPGRTAILAAFRPERHPFLYFRVADADAGRHVFSATFDGHVAAAALSVKPAAKRR
jgi:UPF0755 protein